MNYPFLIADVALCFRFENFHVPKIARFNSTARLECSFDLEGEELYSVKWYKDQVEFYRRMPSENPAIIYFPARGIHVNVSTNGEMNCNVPLF